MTIPRPQNTVIDELLMKLIASNGTPMPTRSVLNFLGAALVDNPDNDSTDVTLSGGTSPGGESLLYMSVGTTTTSSATSIPSGAVVTYAAISIVTPYSDGTTIEVGQSDAVSSLIGTNDVAPTVVNTYEVQQVTPWGGTAMPVLVTVSGSLSVGSAVVVVKYAVPVD
jgi:hypothetical protein